MIGINGNPFVDLSSVVDVSSIDINECIRGLAMCNHEIGTFGPGSDDKYQNSWHTNLTPSNESEQEIFLLSPTKWKTYCKLKYGSVIPTHNVSLTVHDKVVNFVKYNQNANRFPSVVNWIKSTLPNYMSSFGRVLFFVQDHFYPLLEHSDTGAHVWKTPTKFAPKQQFLWINFLEDRPFYIVDDNNGWDNRKNIYTKGKVIWFNSFDVHGAEAQNKMTWALRVDGIFTDDFKSKLGIK